MIRSKTITRTTRGRRRGFSAIAAVLLTLAAGCGRQGSPLPPLRLVPQPLSELSVAQRGERIEISYRVPAASVDGQRLPILTVEILWTTDEGDLSRIAQRRVRKAAPGERLVEVLDTVPPIGRTLRVSGRSHATRRVSALASEVVLRIQAFPPVPLDLSVARDGEDAVLSWKEPTLSPCAPSESGSDDKVEECPSIVGYNVYRRASNARRSERLDDIASATAFRDTKARTDKGWCYSVATVFSIEPLVESSFSAEACTDALDTESENASSEKAKARIESPSFP
ncbi:MAG: hypothetical protein JXO72_05390 [Vicinamibacteria bacterium]|nr:hypothetical protein [Vicinamibacteria bacterium]